MDGEGSVPVFMDGEGSILSSQVYGRSFIYCVQFTDGEDSVMCSVYGRRVYILCSVYGRRVSILCSVYRRRVSKLSSVYGRREFCNMFSLRTERILYCVQCTDGEFLN